MWNSLEATSYLFEHFATSTVSSRIAQSKNNRVMLHMMDSRISLLIYIILLSSILGTLSSYLRLRHGPGPVFASITNISRLIWVYRNDAGERHSSLNRKCGPVVCFGPKVIWVSASLRLKSFTISMALSPSPISTACSPFTLMQSNPWPCSHSGSTNPHVAKTTIGG